MSTYKAMSKTPDMKKYEVAIWWDDHFGHYNYGVEFPDGRVLDPRTTEIKTRNFRKNEKHLSRWPTNERPSWWKRLLNNFLKY